jgi:hypothetical protein
MNKSRRRLHLELDPGWIAASGALLSIAAALAAWFAPPLGAALAVAGAALWGLVWHALRHAPPETRTTTSTPASTNWPPEADEPAAATAPAPLEVPRLRRTLH